MKRKKILFLVIHFFLLAIISWYSLGCALKKGAVTGEEARYERLSDRAYRHMENQKYEKAARLYSKTMTMADDPYIAYNLAKAYARLDQEDSFWQAMEEAVKRGFELAYEIEEEPAFRKYRSDPQLQQIIAEVKHNQKENCYALRESAIIPSIESAPSFSSLEVLEKAFEEEEGNKLLVEWRLSYKEQRIHQQSRSAQKIAALKRYVKDNPEAPDLKEARLAEIESWREMMGWSHWEKETAEGFKKAINDFMAEYPEAPEREELEFNTIESKLRGVIEGKKGCSEEDYPIPLNCKDTLPLMEQYIAQDDGESAWVTRAIGLRANCLFEMHPEHPELSREAYENFVSRPEIPDEEKRRIDWILEIDLRRLKFLFNGAPNFTAETISGKTLSLSDLKGQVVLLDFWSPG